MFNFNFNGGMPGHMHGGPKKEVDTNKFYELLEVDKEADQRTIKKAFRKKAMKHHPDKGGDPEKFKEISKAYETLSDPEKRELYNEYGEEGVQNGGGGMGGATDIFDMLYRRQGGGRGRSQKPKGEDCLFQLGVTLEDMYKGVKKNLRLTRNLICGECAGKGGKGVSTCEDCKGQGIRLIVRQLAPGMIQQMQTRCSKCSGTGKLVQEKCKVCKGKKTVKDKKTLEVYVEKGMKDGEKVVFRGEADQAPDTLPGDVIVVLQQKEHPTFKREGTHLFMKKTVTLVEALCGFAFSVTCLDGRVIKIPSNPGQIIQPGAYKMVNEEGMPEHKAPSVHGNLYIEFTIDFPDSLNANAIKQLRKVLPKPENMDDESEDAEVCTLDNCDIKAERRRHKQEAEMRRRRGGGAQYDEDDDEVQGQRHECGNQ